LLLSPAAGVPAIDRYLLCTRAHSAANQPHAAAAVDRRDRQTNGRTDTRADTRPLYRPCSAHRNMQAASKITYMLTYLRNTELRDAWEACTLPRCLTQTRSGSGGISHTWLRYHKVGGCSSSSSVPHPTVSISLSLSLLNPVHTRATVGRCTGVNLRRATHRSDGQTLTYRYIRVEYPRYIVCRCWY